MKEHEAPFTSAQDSLKILQDSISTAPTPLPPHQEVNQMIHQIPAILALSIPIIAVVSFAIIAIYKIRYHHTERLKMIEKGMNPNDLMEGQKTFSSSRNRKNSFFILIGVGLGLLIGNLLEKWCGMEDVFAYAPSILICLGVALYAKHQYEKRQSIYDKTH